MRRALDILYDRLGPRDPSLLRWLPLIADDPHSPCTYRLSKLGLADQLASGPKSAAEPCRRHAGARTFLAPANAHHRKDGWSSSFRISSSRRCSRCMPSVASSPCGRSSYRLSVYTSAIGLRGDVAARAAIRGAIIQRASNRSGTRPPPSPCLRASDSRCSLARRRRRTSTGRSGSKAGCVVAVRADQDWR
jgi:hypothetical protein